MLLLGRLRDPIHGAQKIFGVLGADGGLLTPITNRGEAAVLYCFIFLFLASIGGGAFSLDRVRATRTTG